LGEETKMTSAEIRDWVAAIGGLLGGVGAIWAAFLARRQKRRYTAAKASAGIRFGHPLPLTPEIRKQWDKAFSFLVPAFVILILAIDSASRPGLADWQVGAYTIGGMGLSIAYVWLGILFGRRAVWMHEQLAVAEYQKSMKKEPNQSAQTTTGLRPFVSDLKRSAEER
jgi:hypothetical protein